MSNAPALSGWPRNSSASQTPISVTSKRDGASRVRSCLQRSVCGAWWNMSALEMVYAALDALHAAYQRIAALEAQVQALKDEIRRYTRAKVE